ncbi:uncharacterized protein LOC127804491 [Diospyros lotus]|uniref:uncharacterized protein LOC127804491 n=1 Tax=Diospyros lotus TaxID=55363 RepID=UPI002257B9E3|nr:uncharacterized protein LOC127804491 [Diospyros lotus]
MRNDITNFMQADMENLYEAWERFKELLRRYPHHGLPNWITIDAAAGGALMGKEIDEAYNLLEEMANNNHQWSSERSMPRRTAGVHEIDAMTALNAKVCEICVGPYVTHECEAGISFIPQPSEQVNYVANQGGRQFNPNENTYNLGWRNHPNFSWSNNQNVLKPPIGFQWQEKKPSLEDLVATIAKTTSDYVAKTNTIFQNQQAAIRNIEMQIGQIANMVNNRAQGTLPSTTENNPREDVKVVTLRSGKQLGEVSSKHVTRDVDKKNNVEISYENEQDEIPSLSPPVKPYVPHIPFPQMLKQNKVFKQLRINIPFADALAQILTYAKFLKEIMSNKRKLED